MSTTWTDVIDGSSAVVSAIKGDKGDRGATGPQGPEGPRGPQGAAGELTVTDASVVTATGALTPRTLAAHFGDGLNLRGFGAVGDGVTDDTAAVTLWLAALMTSGKRGHVPAGSYALAPIYLSVTGDIEVQCDAGALFKYRVPVATPLFEFKDEVGRHRYRFNWTGGTIDNLGGLFVEAEQTNTCISMTRLHQWHFSRVTFRGAATFTIAATATDSGITPVDCRSGSVTGCTFIGQGDAGVYISGGGSGDTVDDGGEVSFSDNDFIQCWQAVTTKRDCPRIIFANNRVIDGYAGFTTLETGGLGAGRGNVIIGNIFKRIQGRAVELRQFNDTIVKGNLIEDFGCLTDGVTTSGFPYAIRLLGNSNTQIEGNKIRLREWTKHAGLVGIYMAPSTINGVLYTPAANLIRGNDFADCQTAILEAASSGANYCLHNTFDATVSTRATFTNAGSLNVFSDGLGVRHFIGSTEIVRVGSGGTFSTRFRTFQDAVGFTRTATSNPTLDFGTVPANGTKDLTVSLAGVTATNFWASVNGGSAQYPTGISYVCRCATDQVIVRAVNSTAAGIVLAPATYTILAVQVS